MRYLQIQGRNRIEGTVSVQGAKNSAVALLPAALLADGEVLLHHIPLIRDVEVILSIFHELGVSVTREGAGSFRIDPAGINGKREIPGKWAKQYRASYYFIGSLIGRLGRLFIGLPGGDDFGERPIDQHLKGFKAMGIKIERSRDGLYLQADKVKGARIAFDVITSGATINMILAAVKAEGETILQNAARDPEVVDLCNLLSKMGAKIYGAGTDTIRIVGVKELKNAEHSLIPDRLMAGTYLIAALATDGAVEIRNVIPEHLTSLLRKLEEMNARFKVGEESLYAEGVQSLKAVRVRTGMYPAFATDLQQPLTALMLKARGKSIVTETVYPNRFSHLPELLRMGAKIERRGATVFIRGESRLTGADVKATDIRAGLSLLIAGMMGEGETRLFGVEHMERGMEGLVSTFHRLQVPIEIREVEDVEEERRKLP